MINTCTISGRLTKDPELMRMRNGQACSSFTLAFNNLTKDEDGEYTTSYVRCYAFRSTAEYISNYAKKGSLVVVSGRLYNRIYQKKDGTNGNDHIIQVDVVELLSTASKASTTKVSKNIKEANETATTLGNDISDDDLPF